MDRDTCTIARTIPPTASLVDFGRKTFYHNFLVLDSGPGLTALGCPSQLVTLRKDRSLMRNKKPRKSLFTWCIRTLAVSLVPSLLLISCASSDSSDTPDTTAPTASFTNVNASVLGTSTFTLTFSEAVTGVSGQTASGACTTASTRLTSRRTKWSHAWPLGRVSPACH